MWTDLYTGPEGFRELSINSNEATWVIPKVCDSCNDRFFEIRTFSSLLTQSDTLASVRWGEKRACCSSLKKPVDSITWVKSWCNSVEGLVPAQIVRTVILEPKKPLPSNVRSKGLTFLAAHSRLEFRGEIWFTSVSPMNWSVRWNRAGSTQRIPLNGSCCLSSFWKEISVLRVDWLSLMATKSLFFMWSHNV